MLWTVVCCCLGFYGLCAVFTFWGCMILIFIRFDLGICLLWVLCCVFAGFYLLRLFWFGVCCVCYDCFCFCSSGVSFRVVGMFGCLWLGTLCGFILCYC